MKSLRLALYGVVFAVLASPVFAQQQGGGTAPSSPPYGYGFRHMWDGPGWGWDGGWYPGFFLGHLFMLLVLIVLVLFIVRLVRGVMWGHHSFGGCPMCGHGRRGAALDILAERFARGEVDKAEYDEKRKALGG